MGAYLKVASRSGRSWESLSGPYRRRLVAGGITRAAYERGASVQKARGHRPREKAYTRERKELGPLLRGLPQEELLRRKLRDREYPAEAVERFAIATWEAIGRWQDAGGWDSPADDGGAADYLHDAYQEIYDDYDLEPDVPEHYHGEGD